MPLLHQIAGTLSLGTVAWMVFRILHTAQVASLQPGVSRRVQRRTFKDALGYVAALLIALVAVAWIARSSSVMPSESGPAIHDAHNDLHEVVSRVSMAPTRMSSGVGAEHELSYVSYEHFGSVRNSGAMSAASTASAATG